MSTALFNNAVFVDVVAAAQELLSSTGDPLLTTRLVASRTGYADSAVRPVIQRLVRSGLLQELPRNGPRAPQYLSVRSADTWATLVALAAQVRHASTSPE